MRHYFLLEATVKSRKLKYLEEGDKVFVIKVKGALFSHKDTNIGKTVVVNLKEDKYYLCKSIDKDGCTFDWSEFIHLMSEEDLEFNLVTYTTS